MAPAFFPALRDAVRGLRDERRHARAGDLVDRQALLAPAWRSTSSPATTRCSTPTTPRARLAFQESLRELIDCFSALDEARFPVVCAIQGGCIGGALDLATACDIRVCSADAFFTVQEITIGMAADLGVLQRLPKIVPQGVAREMAYTGERLGAERALAVGLVNAVLPDAAALLEHAMALARSIAAKSPLAIAGSKLALNHARDHSTASALQQMTLLQSAIFDTGEMATAIAAWKEKRERRSSRPGAGDPGLRGARCSRGCRPRTWPSPWSRSPRRCSPASGCSALVTERLQIRLEFRARAEDSSLVHPDHVVRTHRATARVGDRAGADHTPSRI